MEEDPLQPPQPPEAPKKAEESERSGGIAEELFEKSKTITKTTEEDGGAYKTIDFDNTLKEDEKEGHAMTSVDEEALEDLERDPLELDEERIGAATTEDSSSEDTSSQKSSESHGGEVDPLQIEGDVEEAVDPFLESPELILSDIRSIAPQKRIKNVDPKEEGILVPIVTQSLPTHMIEEEVTPYPPPEFLEPLKVDVKPSIQATLATTQEESGSKEPTTISTTPATPTSPTKPIPSPIIPGIKDSDGFLTPPPASTLLIRRTRTNSSGASSYVIASGPSTASTSSPKPSTSAAALRELQDPDYNPFDKEFDSISHTKKSRKHERRGDTAPEAPEVNGGEGGRLPRKGKGKPNAFSMSFEEKGGGGKGSRFKKRLNSSSLGPEKSNIDPFTGKRRYNRKKRFGLDRSTKKHRIRGRFTSSESTLVRKKKKRIPSLSDKGIWRPIDDLKLIVNMIQAKDANAVHKGVNFSCRYTLEQIEKRFKSLVYNSSSITPNLLKGALKAIQHLHPFVKASVYRGALFSEEEEKILKTTSSKSHPTPGVFRKLLDDNLAVFLKGRNEHVLIQHWWILKSHHMLNDQDVEDYFANEKFEDFEETINDLEIFNEIPDDALHHEILHETNNNLKRIRILEEEEAKWQELVDFGLALSRSEFGEDVYASLKGKNVRFAMRGTEISLGRNSELGRVDADLTEEGPSYKISKRQATIRLRNFGDFVIINEGKNPMMVDGRIILKGQIAKLEDNSIILVGQIRLVFLINQKLIGEVLESVINDENKAICTSSEADLQKLLLSSQAPPRIRVKSPMKRGPSPQKGMKKGDKTLKPIPKQPNF